MLGTGLLAARLLLTRAVGACAPAAGTASRSPAGSPRSPRPTLPGGFLKTSARRTWEPVLRGLSCSSTSRWICQGCKGPCVPPLHWATLQGVYAANDLETEKAGCSARGSSGLLSCDADSLCPWCPRMGPGGQGAGRTAPPCCHLGQAC